MTTALIFANNPSTTLAAPLTSIATSCTVAAGTGALFPSPTNGQAFKLSLTDAATLLVNEIVLVTAVSGDVLTIVRGQEGTTAQNFAAGDLAQQRTTAGTLGQFVQNIPWTGAAATAPVTITQATPNIYFDPTLGEIDQMLPDGTTLPDGFLLTFTQTGTGTCTVTPAAGQSFLGFASPLTLAAQGTTLKLKWWLAGLCWIVQ